MNFTYYARFKHASKNILGDHIRRALNSYAHYLKKFCVRQIMIIKVSVGQINIL
jgi:hypothetical protein